MIRGMILQVVPAKAAKAQWLSLAFKKPKNRIPVD